MKVLIGQLICVLVTFVLMFVCMILPLKVFPQKKTTKTSNRIIAFSNCISGGVFLGTCFVALIPYVHEKFEMTFKMKGIETNFPLTECTVVMGLYLILLIEQLIHVSQDKKKSKEEVQELISIPNDDTGHSESFSSDIEDSDTDDDKKTLTPSAKITIAPANGTRSKSPRRTKRKTKKNASHSGHGHSHSQSHAHSHSHMADVFSSEFGIRCIILLVALGLHGLFEGLAIGLQDDLPKLINLSIAVLIHECLVSFAMGVSLVRQKLKFATALKLSIVFCIMIPIGIFIGMGIGGIHNFAGNLASAIIQGLAAGTFLYVIFLEILPEEINSSEDRLLKVFFLFLGFVLVACISLVIKPHDE